MTRVSVEVRDGTALSRAMVQAKSIWSLSTKTFGNGQRRPWAQPPAAFSPSDASACGAVWRPTGERRSAQRRSRRSE
jgi:hypothetical protein